MRYRSGHAFVLSICVLLTAAAAPVTLSERAESVAKAVGFDREVLIIMKEETGGDIRRMVGYDENDFQIVVNGVSVSVPEDRTDWILASLRRRLARRNYLAFVIEMNEGIKTDTLGVIKGTDQYEILRLMHTDGDQYDITNADVIERLKDWEKESPFVILGADNDWVEIEFTKLPGDLQAFAREVYDFCPDAVDQGPGSVQGLVRDIRRTGKLFLWWE